MQRKMATLLESGKVKAQLISKIREQKREERCFRESKVGV